MASETRYARHELFFGADGQRRLAELRVGIVGLGGLGCHVAQQLAYLGVRKYVTVDGDLVSVSNLNRLVGAFPSDEGVSKVLVTSRLINSVLPDADIEAAEAPFIADQPPKALSNADLVIGCVDGDAPRLQLVAYTAERRVPYIDLASDIEPRGAYGGRVVFMNDGERCLSCLGELDQHELARAMMTAEQRAADDAIYGVDRGALGDAGPSVVSINGVVASLAVTEFLVWATGLRKPQGYLTYRGDRGIVSSRSDPPRGYCYYCHGLWGAEQ